MVANCLFTITNELNAQFCNLNFKHLHALILTYGIAKKHESISDFISGLDIGKKFHKISYSGN